MTISIVTMHCSDRSLSSCSRDKIESNVSCAQRGERVQDHHRYSEQQLHVLGTAHKIVSGLAVIAAKQWGYQQSA